MEAGEERADEGSAVQEFRERRWSTRTNLGGREKVDALKAAGRRNARERIDAFVDSGSFDELGTFAHSERVEDRQRTPGDGVVTGHGTRRGRAVSVAADDITVKRASSSVVGQRRLHRVFEQALSAGNPFVYFGERGGARIPDTLGSEGFSKVGGSVLMSRRRRRIPFASAIVGESFGASTLSAAASDFVVQVAGTCMAMTSPRVIKTATGEDVTMDDLGGPSVHERLTGLIDLQAPDETAAVDAIDRFLSYLPPNSWTRPERAPAAAPVESVPGVEDLVPRRRKRAYDMRTVLARIVDGGEFLELGAGRGRSLICSLGRIDGHAAGIIASQPIHEGGALTPACCDKAVRLLSLCDAFNLPLVFLQDTPGFLVGRQAEHTGLVPKAVMFQQALALAGVPKLTVVVRKAFGLAFFSLGGSPECSDLVCAWPGAEIGFMDPTVGANVLWGDELGRFDEADRKSALAARAASLAENTDPYGAAGVMGIDEIIDPADTRSVLARALGRYENRPFQPGHERPLAAWPTVW